MHAHSQLVTDVASSIFICLCQDHICLSVPRGEGQVFCSISEASLWAPVWPSLAHCLHWKGTYFQIFLWFRWPKFQVCIHNMHRFVWIFFCRCRMISTLLLHRLWSVGGRRDHHWLKCEWFSLLLSYCVWYCWLFPPVPVFQLLWLCWMGWQRFWDPTLETWMRYGNWHLVVSCGES